jgi:hypothetical protein
MKLLNLYLFFNLFSKAHPSLIPTKKICKNCIHFIGDEIECRKFGDTNLITGKVTYHSARSVRENETKCGIDAIYFKENHFKIITVPYYFFKNSWPVLLPSALLSLYFYALLHIISK